MNIQDKSYVYGILITDGSMYLKNNKGKVVLEVQSKDKDICEKLFKIIPSSSIRFRKRNTNFKNNYESCIFSNNQLSFRQWLVEFGYTIEDKTLNAAPPILEYSEKDFWRGVIDGDGSIGFTKDGNPYVSLTTKSELLKIHYCNFLFKNFNIIKNLNRNARDNVYNITIKNEEALQLVDFLYKDASLYLDRKYDAYKNIMSWQRANKKVNRRSWTAQEDEYILNHTLEESQEYLNRTLSSIKNRRYRLTH